jgi:hypothetical protein
MKLKVIFNFILLLALALRLWMVPSALDSTDDVNFALALDHYDLALHQPHFPGYPLYVLVARGFYLFFPATLALALPGVLGSLFLIWAVSRALPRPQSLAAAALLACAPTLVASSAAPGSDGLALALAGAAFAWPFGGGGWFTSGALLGLALGARASYAPLVPSLILLPFVLRRKGTPLIGLAAAVCAWALPLVIVVGPSAFWQEAVLQVGGHFSRWGGSIATLAAGPGERALMLLGQVARGLVPVAVIAAFTLRRIDARVAALLAVPYGVWAWLAQNPDHARHAAPLTALLCVGLALAFDTPRRLALPAAALALGLLQLQPPRPWRRDAVQAVKQRLGVERVLLAGTHLPRVARYYAPELRTAPVLDGADVEALLQTVPPGVQVVVASEVASLDRLQLTPLVEVGTAKLYLASSQPALVRR